MRAIDKFILHVTHNLFPLNEYSEGEINKLMAKFREEADDLNIQINDAQLKALLREGIRTEHFIKPEEKVRKGEFAIQYFIGTQSMGLQQNSALGLTADLGTGLLNDIKNGKVRALIQSKLLQGVPFLLLRNVPIGNNKTTDFVIRLEQPKLNDKSSEIEALKSYRDIIFNLDAIMLPVLNKGLDASKLKYETLNNSYLLSVMAYAGQDLFNVSENTPTVKDFNTLDEAKTFVKNALKESFKKAIKAEKDRLAFVAGKSRRFEVRDDNRTLNAFIQRAAEDEAILNNWLDETSTMEDLMRQIKPIQHLTFGQPGSIFGVRNKLKATLFTEMSEDVQAQVIDAITESESHKNITLTISENADINESTETQNLLIKHVLPRLSKALKEVKRIY